MSYQSFYTDGTVSVANGSTTVTGTGTAWEIAGIVGGLLMIRGFPGIPIVGATDDASLELAWAWSHTAQVNATYAIGLVSADASTALWLNTNVRKVIQQWFMSGLEPVGAGTLAERDALSPAPETGSFWLHWEDGEPLAIYRKEDAGWDGPRLLQGEQGPTGPAAVLNWIDGGWDTGIAYGVNDGLQHNGSSYRCHTAHTSDASTEPGVGVDWEDVWELAAEKGEKGDGGWSAELAHEADGPNRIVAKVVDYIGGEGTKPDGIGKYLGPAGLVDTAAEATSVKGGPGPQGQRGINWRGAWDSEAEYVARDVVTDPDINDDPAAWIAIGPNTNSRPRDNAEDWDLFPGSFPATADYGLITASTETARDYGTIA